VLLETERARPHGRPSGPRRGRRSRAPAAPVRDPGRSRDSGAAAPRRRRGRVPTAAAPRRGRATAGRRGRGPGDRWRGEAGRGSDARCDRDLAGQRPAARGPRSGPEVGGERGVLPGSLAAHSRATEPEFRVPRAAGDPGRRRRSSDGNGPHADYAEGAKGCAGGAAQPRDRRGSAATRGLPTLLAALVKRADRLRARSNHTGRGRRAIGASPGRAKPASAESDLSARPDRPSYPSPRGGCGSKASAMLFVMDAYRVNITGMESRRPPRRIGTHHLADAGSAEPPPSRGQ